MSFSTSSRKSASVENNANAASLTPTVSQRQVKSSIAVASGQTVLLGGLITENQQRSRNGIPVLEELPGGVGNLFSTDEQVDGADRDHHIY